MGTTIFIDINFCIKIIYIYKLNSPMKDGKKSPVFNRHLLKDLRIQKKLSVYELCKISGIQEIKIHKLEKGDTLYPTFDTVAALALGLEVSTDVFINKLSL